MKIRRSRLRLAVLSAILCALVILHSVLKSPDSASSKDAIPTRVLTPPALAVDSPRYLLYEPADLDRTRRHPLVVALSPNADAIGIVQVWRHTADRRQWLVFASKTSQNGVPYDSFLPGLIQDIRDLAGKAVVDPSRILVTGFSGGAMVSHRLALVAPDLIRAVIANTGMMPEYGPDGAETRIPPPSVLASYPRDRLAVMLASPSDFRYQQMKEDRALLESLGWRIRWIEFPGGHRFAQPEVYDQAADWLAQEWGEGTDAVRPTKSKQPAPAIPTHGQP